MAAFDLTMHLIALHHGEAQRMSVEGYFLFQGSELPRSKTEVPLKSHLLQQALKLMDEHLETPLAIGQIAGRLNCNQKYLQRKFVSALGASPAKVYQHKRLNHAKTLLLRSDLSVVEVAVRCGYENTSSMIRSFRNHFGTTPLAYRNALTGR
jgi:transcriptional regulator GlxA family with amidase domain